MTRPVATPLSELAAELRLYIGREENFNTQFEVFIARTSNSESAKKLKLTLDDCRASAVKLGEIHQLILALAALGPDAQAALARLSEQSKPGNSAAA